jgi:hypothetical protein
MSITSKKPTKNKIWFWGEDCKYEVILENARKLQWKIIREDKNENKTNIFWIDVSTINERFKIVLPWQIVNHFPGMVISCVIYIY